jgi:tetratricopeptide (TPR) repeat protein
MVLKTTVFAALAVAFSCGAFAAGQDSPNVSISDIERHLAAKDYTGAIQQAQVIIDASPWNADAFNLMGYALRQIGRFSEAESAYDRALRLDPDHKGAHEYLGELFLQTNRIGEARGHLSKLETICGKDCREYKMLADSIGKAGG